MPPTTTNEWRRIFSCRKKSRRLFKLWFSFPALEFWTWADSQTLGDIKFFDYIVQSGRAVLYPIYQGTYERRVKGVLPGTSQNLEYMTERYKDLARSIDYLETRSDIDRNKLAYLGVSMGSAEGVIFTALAQDRLKRWSSSTAATSVTRRPPVAIRPISPRASRSR